MPRFSQHRRCQQHQFWITTSANHLLAYILIGTDAGHNDAFAAVGDNQRRDLATVPSPMVSRV
ncbi:hypothetical protein KCP69_17855 [Salmonella enterica subsp. enterica]|nr:hypothetical protein KCP69_17855 [Salmonella enterica subsp. enterica]